MESNKQKHDIQVGDVRQVCTYFTLEDQKFARGELIRIVSVTPVQGERGPTYRYHFVRVGIVGEHAIGRHLLRKATNVKA